MPGLGGGVKVAAAGVLGGGTIIGEGPLSGGGNTEDGVDAPAVTEAAGEGWAFTGVLSPARGSGGLHPATVIRAAEAAIARKFINVRVPPPGFRSQNFAQLAAKLAEED